jgi:hypothetical protein
LAATGGRSRAFLRADAHSVAHRHHTALPARHAVDLDEALEARAHHAVRRARGAGDGRRTKTAMPAEGLSPINCAFVRPPRPKFPTVAAMWQRQWEQVIPFFAYPPEVRKIIYTTNAIESMHMQLRKIIKNRGHFPSDEAASKLLYLALRNIEKDWKMPPITWRQAVNQFAILFGERFTNAIS